MNSPLFSRPIRNYYPAHYQNQVPYQSSSSLGPMMNYPVQNQFMGYPNYQPFQPNYYPQTEQTLPLNPPQGNQMNFTNPYFDNPLQQEEYNPYQMKAMQQQAYANPYPKAAFMAKTSPSGTNSIMKSFKSQDGSFDFNKVMNTAGQMMGAVNQVSSLVKGLGGIFKV